jgi:hypothetical protein
MVLTTTGSWSPPLWMMTLPVLPPAAARMTESPAGGPKAIRQVSEGCVSIKHLVLQSSRLHTRITLSRELLAA